MKIIRALDGPIIPNLASDCRDHLANERTFLSWIKMSMYLSIVGSAMLVRFNITDNYPALYLSSATTSYEISNHRMKFDHRISIPIGILLFLLSISCVIVGFINYLATCNWYNYPYHRTDMLADYRHSLIHSQPSSSSLSSPPFPFYDSVKKFHPSLHRPPLASIHATPLTLYFILFLSIIIISLDLLLFIAGI